MSKENIISIEEMASEVIKNTPSPTVKSTEFSDKEKITNFETMKHIREVQENLGIAVMILTKKLLDHDKSKLEEPELSGFTEATHLLKSLTFGSPEYDEVKNTILKKALVHHYEENNRHHPEHFPNGLKDMNLFDIVEMICDWCAAVKRHDDSAIEKSVDINQPRFGYDDTLKQIFLNTAKYLEEFDNYGQIQLPITE